MCTDYYIVFNFLITQLMTLETFQIPKTQLHMIWHVIHKLIWEGSILILFETFSFVLHLHPHFRW